MCDRIPNDAIVRWFGSIRSEYEHVIVAGTAISYSVSETFGSWFRDSAIVDLSG